MTWMDKVGIALIIVLVLVLRFAPQLVLGFAVVVWRFVVPRALRHFLYRFLSRRSKLIAILFGLGVFVWFDSYTGSVSIPVIIAWVPDVFGWDIFSLMFGVMAAFLCWGALLFLPDISTDTPSVAGLQPAVASVPSPAPGQESPGNPPSDAQTPA